MPVVDKYKDMGMVVMGKVEAGEAKKGQSLLLMPNRVSGTVLKVSSSHIDSHIIVSSLEIYWFLFSNEKGNQNH